jgi:hypothetical protein
MGLIMKRVLQIFFIILLIINFSCEDNGWSVNCSDCTTDKPETAILDIKLKSNTSQPVLLNAYEGELADSVLYNSVTTTNTEYYLTVRLNKKYTLTATYQIDGKTYIAVDEASPKVKFTDGQCDNPCYYVYNKVIDLSIKYTVKGK